MLHHPPGIPSTSSFASHALRLLQNVRQGTSSVELVYTSHERWPLPPGQTTFTRPAVHISVLDSSFNPPTLAHLALANSLPRFPSKLANPPSAEFCDAQMLLLSVRNADKVMKPGDASFVQRLEMMHLLSHDICFTNIAKPGEESLQTSSNVAVAIIDEPTFVGKSTLLLRFLQRRLTTIVGSPTFNGVFDRRDPSCPPPSPKLIFLLGFDTLVRIFSSKYYPSEQAMFQMLHKFLHPDQEDCRIVCAYRDASASEMSEAGRKFITSRRITFVDIGAAERTYSSSEVRAKVAAGDDTWRQLVTDGIANYIITQGFYSGSEGKQ